MDGTRRSFPRFKQSTTSPVDGLQVTAGEGELFNHVDSNDYMWAGDGDRVVRQTVLFKKRFSSEPLVSVGMTGIDASQDQNQRYHLLAENITPQGFDLVFITWGDTKIARACASWTAIGSQKIKMQSVDEIETLPSKKKTAR